MLATLLAAGCGSDSSSNSGFAGTSLADPAPPFVSDTHGLGALEETPEELAREPYALDPDVLDAVDGVTLSRVAPRAVASKVLIASLPPVGDQGRSNSCGAWAFGYAQGSYTVDKALGADATLPERQMSPAFLYKAILGSASSCTYTSAPDYFEYLIRNGSASVAQVPFPSTSGVSAASLCDELLGIGTTVLSSYSQFQIGSWDRVLNSNSFVNIRDFLVRKQPVAVLFKVDQALNTWSGTGVFQGSGSFTSGRHFMLVVGFDDDLAYTDADGEQRKGAVRIQNSWGSNWGDGGQFWMSYDNYAASAINAWVEYPINTAPVTSTGSNLGVYPWGGPSARIIHAGQARDGNKVDAVFEYTFDAPVVLGNFTITSPLGTQVTQSFGGWATRSGNLSFVRNDGYQYPSGTYTISLHTETLAGTSTLYTGTAVLGTLPGLPVAEPVN